VRILQSFLAIGGGFLSIAILVAITTLVLKRIAPEMVDEESASQKKPRRLHLLLNLGYSALFGAVGGYVTAWIAHANPIIHTLALALVVLLLSAMAALQMKGRQPVSYQLALTALTPLAVLGGGLLRLKQLGLL